MVRKMAYKTPLAEPIAIVGTGCRFASGADSPSKLWQLLENPTDLSREIPASRFNIKSFYHPDGEHHGTTDSPNAYFVEQDHRVFDAAFFNISPKEAEAIDPQQRLLLEVVYETMESAGYTIHQYAGRKVAVFSGVMTADYDTLSQRDDLVTSQYYATGNARSIVSNRISYFFNFMGPSMTIDTACSSSLVALHQAVLSLRSGESEMACVTGSNMILTPEHFVVESSLHMLSPAGHCRMWDVGANGYARGEGIAAMFVKLLSKALADGDQIEAIIRETGANADGRSKGITMPNWEAQSALIQDTYRRAGLNAKVAEDRCQYFEAHGTGTPAGDPNEAKAINDAFFIGTSDKPISHDPQSVFLSNVVEQNAGVTVGTGATATATPKMVVGSIKTVIGHAEGAAGMAGVLKVVLSMKNSSIPPNLHLQRLNPEVSQYCSNLVVPTKAIPWPYLFAGQPMRASVNSFGFGGSNAHAIIEQYVPELHDDIAKQFHLDVTLPTPIVLSTLTTSSQIKLPLVLSAASLKSMVAVVRTYRDYLLRTPLPPLGDLAWHSYARRTAFPFRLAVSGGTVSEWIDKLSILLEQGVNTDAKIGTRARAENEHPRVLGIFTGQGAQWATMSRSLLGASRVYAKTIRTLDKVLETCPHPPSWTLEQEILADEGLSRIQRAAISQPLCTAVQIALVDLLQSLNVTFHTVIGHSSGEIAAAYASGRISARDAILIAYYRGLYAHLASGADGAKGGMLVVGLSKEAAAKLCARGEYNQRICIAASNSPTSITLSGDMDILEVVRDELVAQRQFARMLNVDTAYHSPHMELPALKYMEALDVCSITPHTGSRKSVWISSVYGFGEPQDKLLRSEYWKANMVKPVLFSEALESAIETQGPFDCAIEIGPHPALRGPTMQTIEGKMNDIMPYSGLLNRKADDCVAIAQFLGWMWTQFASSSAQIRQFVLGSVEPALVNTRIQDAPLYPWDHSQVHYRESRIARQYHFREDAPHELLGSRSRDDNQYQLRWRNVLKTSELPWTMHHQFQGQILLPASAYLLMAVDAARVILAGRFASTIELEDLAFHSGMILEENDPHGVEALFSLIVHSAQGEEHTQKTIEASFTLESAIADGRTSMKQNFSGRLRIALGEAAPEALPSRPTQKAETMPASPESFYHMMEGTGLEYSGPFRGLTSLDRRFRFASGRVASHHAEDTTNLRISPATLDSCLQTAFVAVSSPGDGAIWTSFLPKSIERARFNLAICDIQSHDGSLNVDTYITREKAFSRDGPAAFTAEINIFDSTGNMEIQVEGLTVGSFIATKPEDDYELYLTTVVEIDPECEIVESALTDSQGPSPMLIESCERVAAYYINTEFVRHVYLTSYPMSSSLGYRMGSPLVATPWPGETERTLDEFVRTSPYFHALEFVRRLGENIPDALVGMLPTIVAEAHQLVGFQQHISRVVRQIAHKYPQMNVLGLTDPELGLTEHLLSGLGDSFATYKVGAEPEKNVAERILNSDSLRKKVRIDRVDLDVESPLFLTPGSGYDLVIMTTSMPDVGIGESVVRKVREAMRPGGFLILVHMSRSPLRDRIRRCTGFEAAEKRSIAMSQWSDILDENGFKHAVKRSTQEYHQGLSLIVRQADSHQKEILLRPLSFEHEARSRLEDRLLIVGGKQLWTSLISAGVSQALASRCTSVTTAEALEDMSTDELNSFSYAILLNDIDEPILSPMSTSRMNSLLALLHTDMTILWVTHNARYHNPDNAASFGYTRTLAAETPGLALQILDLDTIDTSPAVKAISDCFARLVAGLLIAHDTADNRPLWVHEPEVHVEDGRYLVPRVLPWKEGNDRYNSVRRIVANTVNTLESLVKVSAVTLGSGKTEYQSTIEQINVRALSDQESSMIQVDYSTAEYVDFGWGFNAYVCIGHELHSGKVRVTLSGTNASYVPASANFIRTVSQDRLCKPRFLFLLIRYLAAFSMAEMARDKIVLLVEPDPMFRECAENVFVKRGIRFKVCTTDPETASLTPGMLLAHPKSSIRQVRSLYPPGESWVFNMLPETHGVSELLVKALPRSCHYSVWFDLLRSRSNQGLDRAQEMWHEAITLAATRSANWKLTATPEMLTVPGLLRRLTDVEAFHVLDWKAERTIAHIVKPLVISNMLSPNRTYVLIGITRDFGQSLATLFVEHGARHIVLASRHPPQDSPKWQQELAAEGINVGFEALDIVDHDRVMAFKAKLAQSFPPVGGIVNGAMVLDDRIFSQMSSETFNRVMNPKTIGSKNLDTAFDSPDLEFFIMTSSFAAIGGHAGQSNYAAANMYMNGLAAARRRRGLAGSVLNIGVIYGLGFLHREKENLYDGLEREGYPPISERDIHHMFLEAIAVGKPVPGQVYDITTGLRRYPVNRPTLHWHFDPRFSHFICQEDQFERAASSAGTKSLKELIGEAATEDELYGVIFTGFSASLQKALHVDAATVTSEVGISDLGVDSLAAVEIRNWIWRNLAQDVAVMKVLGYSSIGKLCRDMATGIMAGRITESKIAASLAQDLKSVPDSSADDGRATSTSSSVVTAVSTAFSDPLEIVHEDAPISLS